MNNQKGEVVLAAMAVVMVVAMVFGMIFMHGGRHDNDRNDHAGKEQQREHTNHDGHQEVK